MVKQRLSKVIFCITLSISVFLFPSVALADDVQDGDIAGEIVVEGVSQEYDFSTMAEIGPNDYTGATSIHTQTSYAFYEWSNRNLGDPVENYEHFSSFTVDVPVNFRLDVERGHTYSGQVYFQLHVNFPDPSVSPFKWRYSFVGLGGFEQQSLYDGITVSYYGFVNFGTIMSSGTCDVTLCVTFDNYQPTFTGTLNVNSSFELVGSLQTTASASANVYAAIPRIYCPCTVSSDWAGELYDYDTDAIVDSDGSLIKNQTIQQQQIANQQSQQSAQQHEDLKNGFQDDTYNTNVSNAGNTVDSYISVESDLMNSQNQIMSNYTDTAFNTGTLAPFTNAIAMCSTWYTWIWNSFGELNVAFVVVLAVGVACLIVGIKKRG